MNETQLIATLLVIIVYCVILIPMVYCFWRLSRYKRKLLMAKKMLQTNVSEDQVTKDQRELTQQQEIQQARVMKGGIDDGQMYLAAHRMKDDSYHCL